MSSLMASSAPGPKPHGEQQFSRAVSSARQDMGLCTPRTQRTQQKDSSKAMMMATSPPFRDTSNSPEEGRKSTAALAFGAEGEVDLAGERDYAVHSPIRLFSASSTDALESIASVCSCIH